MFGWEFPPHNSGGLGTACFGLTRALAKESIDVTFVLPKKIDVSSPAVDFIFADSTTSKGSVSVTPITSILSPYLTSREYSYEYGLSEVDKELYGETLLDEVKRYAFKARYIARQGNFDVIHAHDWLSFLAGIEAKKISGKPLILHVHATEFDRTGGQGVNQSVYDIEKNAMEKADEIIAVSQFTKNKIVLHYGINPDKVEVVHNGIDVVSYKELPQHLKGLRAAGNKIVLSLGRITIQKGVEYFLRSAACVLQHNPNVYFVIVGSGDMKNQMIMEAARLGISGHVIFTPFIQGDSDDVHAMYQSADLFVLPSVSEPFGITPLESIMNGTPAIISKQSGVSEVLSHTLKVDFWDIESMANKILGVLNHDALSRTLEENGRKEVASISWKRAAQKCASLYQRILKSKKEVPRPHSSAKELSA